MRTIDSGVVLTRDLIGNGTDHAELARMTRDGTIDHLRRGAYVRPGNTDIMIRHRLLTEAAARLAESASVVSFGSAAVLHGLPVWPDSIKKVHLTRDQRNHGRIRRAVHVHVSPLREEDVTEVDGINVTTLARTIVDLARTIPIGQALAAGDQAVRQSMSPSDLADCLADAGRRHGIRRARRLATLIDGRAESVGESLSRLQMIERGLPLPDLQVKIIGDQVDSRVDFLWRDLRLIGEFDGKIKYGRLLKPGEDPGDAVFREKVREDRLRELGYEMIRWIWDDLKDPAAFAARLWRAIERAAARVS